MLKKYNKAPKKGKNKLAIRIQEMINIINPEIHTDLKSISSQLDKPITGGVAFRGDDNNHQINDLSVTHQCKGSDGIAFKKIILIHK